MTQIEQGETSSSLENGEGPKKKISVTIVAPVPEIDNQSTYEYELTKFDKIRQKYFKHVPQIGAIIGGE